MKINNGICAPHSTPHPDSLNIFAELQFQIRRAPVSAQLGQVMELGAAKDLRDVASILDKKAQECTGVDCPREMGMGS